MAAERTSTENMGSLQVSPVTKVVASPTASGLKPQPMQSSPQIAYQQIVVPGNGQPMPAAAPPAGVQYVMTNGETHQQVTHSFVPHAYGQGPGAVVNSSGLRVPLGSAPGAQQYVISNLHSIQNPPILAQNQQQQIVTSSSQVEPEQAASPGKISATELRRLHTTEQELKKVREVCVLARVPVRAGHRAEQELARKCELMNYSSSDLSRFTWFCTHALPCTRSPINYSGPVPFERDDRCAEGADPQVRGARQ